MYIVIHMYDCITTPAITMGMGMGGGGYGGYYGTATKRSITQRLRHKT
jgi:hypothetical protein